MKPCLIDLRKGKMLKCMKSICKFSFIGGISRFNSYQPAKLSNCGAFYIAGSFFYHEGINNYSFFEDFIDKDAYLFFQNFEQEIIESVFRPQQLP